MDMIDDRNYAAATFTTQSITVSGTLMLDSLKSVKSLVVRCPNWVGDIVMATPLFECLRENFPDATITACVRPYARGILQDAPWFDHIVPCQDKTLAGLKQLRRDLQAIKPDAGILLTNTTHSWLSFRFAGVPNIYGYRRNLRKYFLADGPEPLREGGRYKPMPMQAYYLELCRYLGLRVPEVPHCRLYMSDEVAQRGRDNLQNWGVAENDLVIGLNPGASFGSSKCWPVEHFAALAELLQETWRCKILLLVGPGEEAIADGIVAASRANIINTADARINLADLKPLIQRCALLVTNDTGPRHYAVSFDVPHIVLMGPTNADWTASNLALSRILQLDLPCVPCHKKVCPLQHHACMKEITPAMVLQTASEMLPVPAPVRGALQDQNQQDNDGNRNAQQV